jgi:hypothetical protein
VKRMVGLAAAVVLAAAGGAAGGYWLAERNLLDSWLAARQEPDSHAQHAAAPAAGEPAKERKVLYYKDPMGNPDTSPVRPDIAAIGSDDHLAAAVAFSGHQDADGDGLAAEVPTLAKPCFALVGLRPVTQDRSVPALEKCTFVIVR